MGQALSCGAFPCVSAAEGVDAAAVRDAPKEGPKTSSPPPKQIKAVPDGVTESLAPSDGGVLDLAPPSTPPNDDEALTAADGDLARAMSRPLAGSQDVVGAPPEADPALSVARVLSEFKENVVRHPLMMTVGTSIATATGACLGAITLSGLVGALTYVAILAIFLTVTVFLTSGAGGGSASHANARTASGRDGSEEGAAARPTKRQRILSRPGSPRRIAPPPESPPRAQEAPAPIAASAPLMGAPLLLLKKRVQEPRTGHKFPYVMDEHDGYPAELELLSGLGVREKKILVTTLNIYAVGIYLNAPQLKAVFGDKYGAASQEKLLASSVVAEVAEATDCVSRTIRIVIQFKHLTSKMLVDSFDERLEHVMKEAGEEDIYEGLRKGLGSIELNPGRTILLRMKTDGTLLASSEGKLLAESKSHTLCRAVMAIYLGPNPASEDFKADVYRGIHATLHCPHLASPERPPGADPASSAAPSLPPNGVASDPAGDASKQGDFTATNANAAVAGVSEERANEEGVEGGGERAGKRPSKGKGEGGEEMNGARDGDGAGEGVPDLSGIWKVVHAENLNELVVELGLNPLYRRVAVQLYTHDMKIIEQEGRNVTFTDFRNRKRRSPVCFVEGQVVRRKDKQGVALTDTAHWEGDTLKIVTEGRKYPLHSTYRRESETTMVMQTRVNAIVMTRIWELQQES